MNLKRRIYNFFHYTEKVEVRNAEKLRLSRILFCAVVIVILLWASTFWVVHWFDKPDQIGDSFGIANALFSALAFAFLIYTSLLQTEELRLQRKEITDNRQELTRSADAQAEMVKDRIITIGLKLIDDLDSNLRNKKFHYVLSSDSGPKKYSDNDYLTLIANWQYLDEANHYFSGQITLCLKQVKYFVSFVENSQLPDKEIAWLLQKGAIQFGYDLLQVLEIFNRNAQTTSSNLNEWEKQFHTFVNEFFNGPLTTLIYFEIDIGGNQSDLLR